MKNKTIQKSSSYPPPLELNCRLNSRLLILLGKPQKKVTPPPLNGTAIEKITSFAASLSLCENLLFFSSSRTFSPISNSDYCRKVDSMPI